MDICFRRVFTIAVVGVLIFARGDIFLKVNAADINASSSVGSNREELQLKIQQKTQELEHINGQLKNTQKNLESIQSQRRTLQKDLTSLQSNINQLDLKIQGDAVSVQKLGLEIDSLNYDLRDVQSSIDDKEQAVNKLLLELQKNDAARSTLLTLFLKGNTLAEGVMETQSLLNVRNQLSSEVNSLGDLSKELSNKIEERSSKKSEVEFHHKNLAARRIIVTEQQEERKIILAQTKNQEEMYQQQLTNLKKQQDLISDGISKIEDQLRASFNVGLLPTKRSGVFAWPLAGSVKITQHFAEKSYLYRYKAHNGLDLGASVGTPVFAADDGTVIGADNNDRSRWRKYQYGKYILIEHTNNLATLYAHLSEQVVGIGKAVKRGELIGYSGNTGYATGPHLHFGVYWAPSISMKSIPPAAGLVPVGVTINPEDYL